MNKIGGRRRKPFCIQILIHLLRLIIGQRPIVNNGFCESLSAITAFTIFRKRIRRHIASRPHTNDMKPFWQCIGIRDRLFVDLN